MKTVFKTLFANLSSDSERRQLFRFGVSGVINTLAGFIIYSAAILLISAPFWIANFFAVLGGICTGYFLAQVFVFVNPTNKTPYRAIKYAGLIGLQYIIGTFLIGCLVFMGLNEIISYILTLPIIVLVSYLVQRNWIF